MTVSPRCCKCVKTNNTLQRIQKEKETVISGMQDSGEISSEKWSAILAAHFLEIQISMGTGEEKSEHMIPGPGIFPAYVERLRETGFNSQESEG